MGVPIEKVKTRGPGHSSGTRIQPIDYRVLLGVPGWTRPGLDLQSRSICTLAALTVLGREGPLHSHINGALNIGLNQEEIIEVFIQTTFYGAFHSLEPRWTLLTKSSWGKKA
ncbi:MAG: hypothetical protein CM1200mP22_33650 [Dehalococcoidia bacterium]|nr:MAG: hypothetical protein CM1200mP22_33650 [Dehalococcoidia bacterium]